MNRRAISWLFAFMPATVAAGAMAAVPPDQPASEATEPVLQGAYGDWSLYDFQENGGPVCYLASRILKSSEPVPGRRPSYVLITNRPAEGKKGVVSIVAGFSYQEGSPVTVAIGRKQFHLFTDRDTAWAEDGNDSQIVAAIRGGSTLNVNGHAKDGPVISDNFSLKGVGQALAALDQACPMPGKPAAKAVAKKHKKKAK
jgi:invasion protein IalB